MELARDFPLSAVAMLPALSRCERVGGLAEDYGEAAAGRGSEVKPVVSLDAAAPARSSEIPRLSPGPRSDPFLARAVEESSTCGTRHLAEPRSGYRSPAVVLRRMSAIGEPDAAAARAGSRLPDYPISWPTAQPPVSAWSRIHWMRSRRRRTPDRRPLSMTGSSRTSQVASLFIASAASSSGAVIAHSE